MRNNVAHTRYAGNRIRDGKSLAYGEASCFPGRVGVRKPKRSVIVKRDPRARYAACILIIGLLASLAVAAFRLRTESHARRVEIAMDYSDFIQLARSYDYNPAAFLIALRRAGLTSLALTEELGSDIGTNGKAYAATGGALVSQAALTPIADPLLASLARAKKLDPSAVYLIVTDAATFARYREQLPLHFMRKSVRVLRDRYPWLIEVHTQLDYFDGEGLGIPTDQLLLAKRLGLLVIPRLQNDERFARPQMEAQIADVLRIDPKVSTVVFFGLRNQVWGYPDHLPDAGAVFHDPGHVFNFGSIETYDPSQVQKGGETLGKEIPGRTVRVQAIARTELEKISLDDAVDRYVLGVRERNVRVVYLRSWQHQDGNLTIEQTNVEMVRRIAGALKAHGFRLGRATPVPAYRGDNRVLVGLAALCVPSIFTVLLILLGWYRRDLVVAAYAATIVLYVAGIALHHDLFARSVIALAGALLFEVAAFLALAPAFADAPKNGVFDQSLRSARWTLVATGVALLGALVVVGLMSSPLAMEEIERFRGVKLVLAVPPVAALLLYLFSGKFPIGSTRARDVLVSPIQAYQLFAGIVIIACGALLVMRSGNESEVAPSHLELVVRHVLESALSVRPRFKEFLVGYPSMMLVAALVPAHRRAVGWLLALGAGVGIGDIVDTFSHLHTPLFISVLRIVNGLWIGILIGAIVIWIYRRFVRVAS
jgi:hypothetical protein